VQAGDPRRAQLLAHAQSWASQAMARRLASFYERVRAATKAGVAVPRDERGPGATLEPERGG